MSSPAVSVIIPAYNGAKTIRASLDSALAQTFTDYEIIVVDDCSRDETAKIVGEYGGSVRLHRREKNSGICEIARSEGVSQARGCYAAFLDQDDLWTPDKLERQVAFMDAHEEFPLSHTSMKIIDEHDAERGVRHGGNIPPSGPCALALLQNCFITISSIMVRPQVWLEAADPYRLADAYSDFDYFLSILRKFPAGFGFLPDVLGSYRIWTASMSHGDWRRRPRDVVSLSRVLERRLWEGLVPEPEVRGILSDAALENAQHWRDRGHADRALWFGRRAFTARPSCAAAASLLKSLGRVVVPRRKS